MDCESKLEAPGSPDRGDGMDKEPGADGGIEGTGDCGDLKGADDTDDRKKRKRKPYRPGDCRSSDISYVFVYYHKGLYEC